MTKKAKHVTEAPAAKTNAGKALATKPAGGRAIAQHSSVGGRGFENIDRKDVLMPRIKLLQQLSPEVTGGMKAGTMLVGLSNKNLGTKVVITPILHFRSRIKWIPKDEGGGIECSSPNAKKPLSDTICADCSSCPEKDWNEKAKTPKEKAPKCTIYENFIVLVGDSKEPVLLPMERTKLAPARKFFSMGALKNCDMWNWKYELSVIQEENDKKQPYFNYVVTDLCKATSAEVRANGEQLWSSLHEKTITSDLENPDIDNGVGTAAPVGESKF